MMDSAGAKVNFVSNQQDSLVRQIRLGVYSSCDRSILRVSVDQRDFIILEKLRKESCINRTDNRHRWTGRVDQGEREKVV